MFWRLRNPMSKAAEPSCFYYCYDDKKNFNIDKSVLSCHPWGTDHIQFRFEPSANRNAGVECSV